MYSNLLCCSRLFCFLSGEDGVGMRGGGTVSAVGAMVWLGGLVGFSRPSDNAAHQVGNYVGNYVFLFALSAYVT
jgi:hypothetical protein